MADVRQIKYEVIIDESGALKGMKRVDKSSEEMEKRAKKSGDGIGKTVGKMRSAYVLLAGVITGVVAVAFGKALKAASDFEEANSKFGVVFRGVSKEANVMRKSLVNSFGLSSIEASNLLSSTGDLLTGFGFTRESALDLSSQVNELAVDLASFANFEGGAAGASIALTKALLGESESAKALGIVIRQDSAEYKTLVEGFMEAEGATLLQAKAMTALKIATDQSKNAIGDFERTQNSLANTLRKTKAIAADVTLIFGQELLRTIQPLVEGFTQVDKIRDNMDKLKNVIRGIFIFSRIAFEGIKATITGLFAPVILLTELFIETGRVIKSAFTGGISGVREEISNFLDRSKEKLKEFAESNTETWKKIGADTISLFKQTEDEIIQGMDNIVVANDSKNTAIIESDKMTSEEIKKEQEKRQQLISAGLSGIKDLSAELGNFFTLGTQNRIVEIDSEIAKIDEQAEAQIQALSMQGLAAEDFQKKREQLQTKAEGDRKKLEIQRKAEQSKQAKQSKANALFQAIIGTATAIIGALAAPGVSNTVKIVQSVIIGALGAAQIAVIAAQKIPSFGKGGDVNGPAHTSGGVTAELEGGEYVVQKSRVTPATRPILENINGSVGRISGLANNADMAGLKMQTGGEVPTSTSNSFGGDSLSIDNLSVAAPNADVLIDSLIERADDMGIKLFKR